MSRHRLLVMRHAHAQAPPAVPDVERPLSDRGQLQSAAAAAWLRGAYGGIDLIVCSAARRAAQTAQIVGDLLDPPPPVQPERRLYDNDPETALEILRQVADEVGSLLLVSHSPSVSQLVASLADGLDGGFPTAAIAVVEFDGDWSDAGGVPADLTAIWEPGHR